MAVYQRNRNIQKIDWFFDHPAVNFIGGWISLRVSTKFLNFSSPCSQTKKIYRGFVQEKLIEHFYSQNHHGTHRDMIVQIIGSLWSKRSRKARKLLDAQIKNLYPDGLYQKQIIKQEDSFLLQLLVFYLLIIVSDEVLLVNS